MKKISETVTAPIHAAKKATAVNVSHTTGQTENFLPVTLLQHRKKLTTEVLKTI